MSMNLDRRVAVCKSYTPGLTTGKTYIVRDVGRRMVETLDDRGNVLQFWGWRFDPGPPVPPPIPWRMGE